MDLFWASLYVLNLDNSEEGMDGLVLDIIIILKSGQF